jgi:hypothetical protein
VFIAYSNPENPLKKDKREQPCYKSKPLKDKPTAPCSEKK